MPNFANVQLMGHLGQDPESSYIGETPVLRFSLAVNTGFKEKKTTSWYRCAMFGTRAKAVAPMLSKGSRSCFGGTVHQRVHRERRAETDFYRCTHFRTCVD